VNGTQPGGTPPGGTPQDGTPPQHARQDLTSGLLETVPGLALFTLSLYYLLTPWTDPKDVAGVMLPLTMSVPAVAFGLRTLLPLRYGDTPETLSVTATVWFGIAAVAAVVTAAGAARSQTIWAVMAFLPIVVVGAVFRGAVTQRRAAARDRTT
jgi:hypothetical protein